MTQPKYAPIARGDEVRAVTKLEPTGPWVPHRPGDPFEPPIAQRRGGGVPGPDQGYALRLSEGFRGRLVLTPGEHEDDVLAGAVGIALRRAALFGRAPVRDDVAVALELFGFVSSADGELVALRKERFAGAAHDYWKVRELVAAVPEESLRLPLAGVSARRDDWRVLVFGPGSSGS